MHCATQLFFKPLTESASFKLAVPCCSPPLPFMPDMKPNPDATEVIWNGAICFIEMTTEFTVCRFKYYEWGEVGNEVTQEKESSSLLHPLNRSCELSLLWYVSSRAAVFCHPCCAMLNLDSKFLTSDFLFHFSLMWHAHLWHCANVVTQGEDVVFWEFFPL